MNTNPKLIDVSSDSRIADALGEARAALKVAQDEVKFLEGLIKSKHATELLGEKFRVKVAYDVATSRVDWKSVAEYLKPSRQLVTAHTKVSTSDRITVTAHKKHAK